MTIFIASDNTLGRTLEDITMSTNDPLEIANAVGHADSGEVIWIWYCDAEEAKSKDPDARVFWNQRISEYKIYNPGF